MNHDVTCRAIFDVVAGWDQNTRFHAFTCLSLEDKEMMIAIFHRMLLQPDEIISCSHTFFEKLKNKSFTNFPIGFQGSEISKKFVETLFLLAQISQLLNGHSNADISDAQLTSMVRLVEQFCALRGSVTNEKIGHMITQFEEKLPQLTNRKVIVLNKLFREFHLGHLGLDEWVKWMAVHLQVRIHFSEQEMAEMASLIPSKRTKEPPVAEQPQQAPLPIKQNGSAPILPKEEPLEVAQLGTYANLSEEETLIRALLLMVQQKLVTMKRTDETFEIVSNHELFKINFEKLNKLITVQYYLYDMKEGGYQGKPVPFVNGDRQVAEVFLGESKFSALFDVYCQNCASSKPELDDFIMVNPTEVKETGLH